MDSNLKDFDLQLFAEGADGGDAGGGSAGDGAGGDNNPESGDKGGGKMPGQGKDKSAGSGGNPSAASPAGGAGANPGMEAVSSLYSLLSSDPGLANAVADLLEQYSQGGAGAPPAGAGAGAMQGAGMPRGAGPGAGMPGATIPPELLDRLSRVERGQADVALERELSQAREAYSGMQQEFPILPELNDREIMQVAAQYPGLPLEQAVNIWAMQQMRGGGEGGSASERIMAAMMEKQQQNQPPSPEGQGGSAPSGETPPPQNFRQARKGIRDLLATVDRGVTGA